MGHFGRRPIQLAWNFFVLPALAMNYLGQGAAVLAKPEAITNPFYLLAPEWALIPMVILAIIQVILDLKGVERKQRDDAAPVDFQFSQTVEPKVAKRRAIIMFCWFFGFFFGIWLLGFAITIPLMVFTYLKIQSN